MRMKVKIALFGAVLLSLLWGFQLMLTQHALWAFSAPEEDLSYGYYVPLFSLYVVWRERKKILACASLSADRNVRFPDWVPILIIPALLFLGFIGIRGAQLRFEIVAFAGLIWTISWAFWGWKVAKELIFPCGFLLFCIPLNSFLDVITVHLRLFATGTAFAILHGLGVNVIRTGTMLSSSTGSFAIDVAAPCSGLRSIFALMTLTAAYSYFAQPTWLRRGLLFASSVPLAIFGNICRIFTIVLTASYCDPDFATGFYHDYSGYVVFLVAVACMLGVSGGINKVADK